MITRIDKLLADSGFGTRSEVKKLLREGSVKVNGNIVKDPGFKADTEKDEIFCRGERIGFTEFEYYLLYKPAGIITASRDRNEKTVVDLIESKRRRDISPVGRLDRDTEGLLLITNDGQLAHRLLAPGKHVDKVYLALVSGRLPDDVVERFKAGLDIGDETFTKPAVLKVYENPEEAGDERISERYEELVTAFKTDKQYETGGETGDILTAVSITLTEGRYHEIKRMFQAVGAEVQYLKRISMGKLTIPADMHPGDYKEIKAADIVSG